MSPPGASPQHAVVPLVGRGALPFALLHGRPLHAHAVRTLVELDARTISVVVEAPDVDRVRRELAAVARSARVVVRDDWWRTLRDDPTGLLVHDSLCPLASADFLASVAAEAARRGTSTVAFRPVTDTVKTAVAGRIHGTIDRGGLAALIAPAVLVPEVVRAAAGSDDPPPLADFGTLVTWLRSRAAVVLVKGPSLARRVDDASAVNLLESVDELRRQVRIEPGATHAAAVIDG